MLTISGLYIYPIKSLGCVSVGQAMLEERGLQHDRRWMLADTDNKFISQREFAVLALLQVNITEEGLQVTNTQTGSILTVPYTPQTGKKLTVQIWSSKCSAQPVNALADEWFSEVLSKKCRLVYMPDSTRLRVDGRYANNKDITSFSDGYPNLVIGQASLDDLNSRLAAPLPMDRFRPNIVFTGGYPFQEDDMEHFTVQGIDFYGVKLCARCVVTTIDQHTAAKGKEPLKTLATYRKLRNNIYFGQNLLHQGSGVLRLGDEIEIKQLREKRAFRQE